MDISQVESITVAQAEELLEQQPSSIDAVGKICQDFNWYAVCVFDEDDMVHFEGVEDVYLDILCQHGTDSRKGAGAEFRRGKRQDGGGVPVLHHGRGYCRGAQ